MAIFFSLFAYAAAKNAGVMRVSFGEIDARWRGEPASSPWVGWRTLAATAKLGEPVTVLVDGSTLITKARSRAAGRFLASGADVWVTCDDDVWAEAEVLTRLVAACRATHGVVALPCLVRDGSRVNVGLTVGEIAVGSDLLANAARVGMGCVAMHVEAIRAAAKLVPVVLPGPGEGEYPALFLEHVEGGVWQGEDWAFSKLCVRAGAALYALCEAPTMHAGLRAQLSRDLNVLIDPTNGKP